MAECTKGRLPAGQGSATNRLDRAGAIGLKMRLQFARDVALDHPCQIAIAPTP